MRSWRFSNCLNSKQLLSPDKNLHRKSHIFKMGTLMILMVSLNSTVTSYSLQVPNDQSPCTALNWPDSASEFLTSLADRPPAFQTHTANCYCLSLCTCTRLIRVGWLWRKWNSGCVCRPIWVSAAAEKFAWFWSVSGGFLWHIPIMGFT